MSENTLTIGDTVRILPYIVTTMSGLSVEGYLSNKLAVVTGFSKDYSWRSRPNLASLRVLEDDDARASTASRPLDQLALVTKGPGFFELGKTHPFSKEELQDQRWAAFVDKANSLDLQHEGFSNAATFLAWIYLNQEPKARHRLTMLVRKDGTLNPGRVEKLFVELKLAIDAWAFECPLEVPEEFKFRRNPVASKQAVNWAEVAKQFEPEALTA